MKCIPYAINSKSGAKLWEFETGDMAFGPDGTIYTHMTKKFMPSKYLHSSNDLAWQNAQRTGR